MTSREIIQRVLARDNPPRIGLTYSKYQGEPRISDVAGSGPAAPVGHDGAWRDTGDGFEHRDDEWGCLWRRVKGKTDKGEPVRPAITDWADYASYQFPTLDDPGRYTHCPRVREEQQDRYLLGSLHGCAFNYARYLRQFDQYLLDCAAWPEEVRRLNTDLTDLAIRQCELYAGFGFDGVMFAEDWGTEDRLLVSPRMWHDLFRPGFVRLIETCHGLGLTVWMHSCGYVKDIIPTLVELGLDVFQFDQPELSGLDFLAQFDVTYWCPVDIQKTLPTGDRELIQARAAEMITKLGGRGGGFIAKDYPDNPSIGVDPLWQHWGYEVFCEAGRYPLAEGA